MKEIQVHPTSFVPISPRSSPSTASVSSSSSSSSSTTPQPEDSAPSYFLAPEALRGVGGILLDDQGNRFVNELGYVPCDLYLIYLLTNGI